MAKFPLSAIQGGSIELDNEILDDASDTEAKDIPASPSLPEDNSMQPDEKSLKITLHRSGIGSPILEHGLPYCGDWSGSRATDLDNDPFLLRGSTFPAFESRHPRLSADWLQILQEGNKRYELRDVDRSTFRGSGWIVSPQRAFECLWGMVLTNYNRTRIKVAISIRMSNQRNWQERKEIEFVRLRKLLISGPETKAIRNRIFISLKLCLMSKVERTVGAWLSN